MVGGGSEGRRPAAEQEPVQQQEDDRPENGHKDGGDVDAGDYIPTHEETDDEAADDRSRDPDQHRDDAATRISSWQEQLGDDSGDQTNDDPAQNAHRPNLPRRVSTSQRSQNTIAQSVRPTRPAGRRDRRAARGLRPGRRRGDAPGPGVSGAAARLQDTQRDRPTLWRPRGVRRAHSASTHAASWREDRTDRAS